MVGSLSGIMEEVKVAKEVIRNWNQENAEREGKVFLNMDWNEKTVDVQKIDVVIGIVGSWIEKTDFVEECLEDNILVILLFNAYQDPENTIASERDEVKAFKDHSKKRCQCVNFIGVTDLKELIERKLETL